MINIVEYNLYYYFAFMEKHEDGLYYCINREEFQKEHSKVFNECDDAIVNILGEVKRKGSGSLSWEYIQDNNGHNYDFKHFSDNCVELKDNYVKEATRIADIIINLKKAVENKLL
ncbi:hypothetical protein ACUH7Y_14465 [Clostridium beijerinckii]|uniref:Uncharacterized protein n=2 Tax=Clostridiaceae TaxID=31979 RepID=A0A1B9BFK5_CLOBE|nr:hypothetical protein [Clostridium beijerinckii]NMF05114.1 hypothetical protein [Clostridium beijerinckii]OCA96483.1 hypothetical protein BGS1_08390 [Clostridium beijerinckii]